MARSRISVIVYGGSIALHVALAVGAILAPSTKRHEAVAIAIAEPEKKPKPEKKDPPPPPPPPPASRAKSAPAPKPAATPEPPPLAAPVAAAPAYADLGLTLGNGPGSGMAVAAHGPSAAREPASEPVTTRKVAALVPKTTDACDEPLIKPKARTIVKPSYSEEARAAQIEGVVRVEITIDPTGRVVDVRILRGLGHGLDDAALAAARQMAFEPGTRCGRPTVATISVGMRFALGS